MKILVTILISLFIIVLAESSNAQTSRNMTQEGNLSVVALGGGALNDIWGYVDSLGNEYAIIGVQNGIKIVDVTVPSSPVILHTIAGASSTWRDIRVWKDFAYVTCEELVGLMIIDLRYIQDSVPFAYTNLGIGFDDAHNITVDENGIAYLVGGNSFPTNGAVICDLNPDPWNPVHLGNYSTNYIHDAIVRNDTMYSCEIYTGKFAVVDMSDKSSAAHALGASVVATQATSNNFTHQCWLSDDNNYLFAVDEQGGAYIDAFDIKDYSNIQKVDRIQSNPGSGVIPHNTFYHNGYLYTSYYKDGVTIHDATRPNNLVQVGYYDTYTAGSGGGFSGCWGVYPFLPSGNIIASDRNTGLHILSASEKRGCYVEGKITDDCSGFELSNVNVEILGGFTGHIDASDFTGDYAVATVDAGSYDIVFSKSGYISDTIKNVSLSNATLVNLDVTLSSGNDVIISNILGSDVGCFGGETGDAVVSVLGGVAPYTYLWSNGQTGSTATNLMAGIYTVTVADVFGCTASGSVIISEPAPINITTSKSNVSCSGGSNGSANAVASGGTPTFTYSWNTIPAQSSQAITDLVANAYTVTVTDENGCTAESVVNVNMPTTILTFNIPANPSSGQSDGSINLLVSGGINPYTYNWSTGASTEDIAGIPAGFYFCQVSDRNGCADIEVVTLSSPAIIAPQAGNAISNNHSSVSSFDFDVRVFPNPGNGEMGFVFRNVATGRISIEMMDIKGRLIKSLVISDRDMTHTPLQINVGNEVTNGLYVIRITSDTTVKTVKYLLER